MVFNGSIVVFQTEGTGSNPVRRSSILNMKILPLSDLHLEFDEDVPKNAKYKPSNKERNVLVLAGDIHTGTKAEKFIKQQLRYSDIVYVLGNHEYYNNNFETLLNEWKEKEVEINEFSKQKGFNHKLYVLQNSSIVIGNTKFIGFTMWTSLNSENEALYHIVDKKMNDYACITDNEGFTISPNRTIASFYQSKIYLKEELSKSFDGSVVVVSHHAPHEKSIADGFNGDILNGAYYEDMSEFMINDNAPNLWIHGHVHNSFDYIVGNTRVVSNPRGYNQKHYYASLMTDKEVYTHDNADFNKSLIIELDNT